MDVLGLCSTCIMQNGLMMQTLSELDANDVCRVPTNAELFHAILAETISNFKTGKLQ